MIEEVQQVRAAMDQQSARRVAVESAKEEIMDYAQVQQ